MIQLISHLSCRGLLYHPFSLIPLSITLRSDLTKSIDSQGPYKSQFGHMTSIDGMLALYLMNRILIRVSEKNNDDASAKFKETERLDKEMIERWLGEADSTIIFVCARSTILSVSPSKLKNIFQGYSVLGCRRGLPC